jgi:hypothetical protein
MLPHLQALYWLDTNLSAQSKSKLTRCCFLVLPMLYRWSYGCCCCCSSCLQLAPEITAEALEGDPIAQAAVDMFLAIVGAEAGAMGLRCLAQGKECCGEFFGMLFLISFGNTWCSKL